MSIKRIDIIITGIVFFLIAILLFVFARSGYPLFSSDSICFVPTIIHLHQGEGLVNTYYQALSDVRFLYYTPMFPYFQNVFMCGNNITGVYMSLTLTSLLCLAFCAISLLYILRERSSGMYKWILIILALTAIASGLDISSGRPEILVNLLCSVLIFTYLSNLTLSTKYFLWGGLFAILLLCSIVSAIYVFFILIIYSTLVSLGKKEFLLFTGSFMVVILFFVISYPYKLSELYNGLLQHTKNVVIGRQEEFHFSEWIRYHLSSTNYSFYFLLFLLSFWISFKKLFLENMMKKGSLKFYLVLLSFIGLCLSIYYFGFRVAMTNYYVYNLYIFYVFIIIYAYKEIKYVKWVSILLLLASIGFIRRTVLFFHYYNRQYTLSYVKQKLDHYNIVNYGSTTSFWIFDIYKEQGLDTLSDPYTIHQQTYSGYTPDDSIKAIVWDARKQDPYKLFGITVANNPPFYHCVIYKSKQNED